MSGSVAQDQIKSYVDRILRLKEDHCEALASRLRPKMARLNYVIAPLAEIGCFSTVASDRAVTAGARLLGVRNDTLRHRAQMSRRKGSVESAVNSIAEWMSGEIWPVPEFQKEWVGFVYIMAADDFPGIFKVGFSRNPDQRLAALSSAHRIKLSLVHSRVATELDEHLVQHHLERFRLANEWFDFGGEIASAHPAIRFYTPARMWDVLREAA